MNVRDNGNMNVSCVCHVCQVDQVCFGRRTLLYVYFHFISAAATETCFGGRWGTMLRRKIPSVPRCFRQWEYERAG